MKYGGVKSGFSARNKRMKMCHEFDILLKTLIEPANTFSYNSSISKREAPASRSKKRSYYRRRFFK